MHTKKVVTTKKGNEETMFHNIIFLNKQSCILHLLNTYNNKQGHQTNKYIGHKTHERIKMSTEKLTYIRTITKYLMFIDSSVTNSSPYLYLKNPIP